MLIMAAKCLCNWEVTANNFEVELTYFKTRALLP